MNEAKNMKISGAGVIGGGEYGEVAISGSGKVLGDVKCEEFRSSGAAKAEGSIECSGDLRCSGALSCRGNLTAKGSVKISGSCKAEGFVKGTDVDIAGALNANDSVTGESLRIRGYLETKKDVEGEFVSLCGGCKIGGMLNGETVELYPSRDQNDRQIMKIPTVGGSAITVEGKGGLTFWKKLFGIGSACRLISDLIEGDTVDLSDTECHTVRGKQVTIRKNCRINRVEYSESLTVDPSSTVTIQEKI